MRAAPFIFIARLCRLFGRDRNAALLPVVALMLPVILGMAGLGVDASVWVMTNRTMQTSVDAAVMAAAWEVANGRTDNAQDAALREAENNGYNPALDGSLDITITPGGGGSATVTGSIKERAPIYFSSAIYHGQIFVASAAASALITPTGDYCVLSLDPTGDGAITAVGSVNLDSQSCGLAINSNSDSALDLSGFVTITVNDINIVGEDQTTGNVQLNYNSLKTEGNSVPDPYASLDVPDHSASCDYNNKKVTKDTTLYPGNYCGGLSISGNETVTFEPGVYYMIDGGFSVTGGGSLVGDNVSFVFTSSGDGGSYGKLDISGGKQVTFTAPEEGQDMAGVVFYQDRNAPADSSCNKLIGTSDVQVDGAVYFPSQCIEYGGDNGANATNACSRIIAQDVKFNGNPNIGNNCENVAVQDIGQFNVRLIK